MARGLGKGLSALLGSDTVAEVTVSGGTRTLRISDIEPNPNQPRRVFDEEKLRSLADSIKKDGLLQPIVVRKVDENCYCIVAGERRWRASRLAGLSEVPVTIIDADDRRVAELALIENLQREDLNPIEEAEGFGRLQSEYAMTQDDIASTVGKSRPAVANALRLLSLPESVRTLVSDGKLSAGHARTLLSLGSADKIQKAADVCIDSDMSVRALERYVKSLLTEKIRPAIDEDTVNYFAEVEHRLSLRLGRKLKFHAGRKKGKLEIEYYDAEDLETLIGLLDSVTPQDRGNNNG